MSEKINDDVELFLLDEVQLVDFGETRSLGPYIKLKLKDPDQLSVFRGLDTATAKKTGHIFNICLTQGTILPEEPKKKKGLYGEAARKLKISGFLMQVNIAEKVGTDKEFATWIQTMPCIICGNADLVEETGEMVCEAAHVRRSSSSGTGYKGLYMRVPLCHKHHLEQHGQGEQDRELFDTQAAQHRHDWVWFTLKQKLGCESWSQVEPRILREWCQANGISEIYLPVDYKGL